MSKARIELETFRVILKQDVDKEEPYIWVIGIVMDLKAANDQSFVIKKNPTYGNIGEHYAKGDRRTIPEAVGVIQREIVVAPEKRFGFGVLVAALEHDTTSKSAQQDAYDIVAAELQTLLANTVTTQTDPTKEELEDMIETVKSGVKSVFKRDANWFNVLFAGGVDDYIDSEVQIFQLVEGKAYNTDFELCFLKNSVEYRIQANLIWNG